MNDRIIQKVSISFACPDCEFGEMHESDFSQIPYYFVCDSCHSAIVYSKKTYAYMHRETFKLPSMKQSVDPKVLGTNSENSYPSS